MPLSTPPRGLSFEELAAACQNERKEFNRAVQVIAESNRNDRKIVIPREQSGWGLDSQWNDDFHHSLRVTFTGEQEGYYEDFDGIVDLALAFGEGFVYAGQYPKFRKRRHGSSPQGLAGERFVVFAQNHDQVGNRKAGDRLTSVASFEQLKMAAAAVLLSPYVPLLFMGEDYGETAPFQYFVSHSDPAIVDAVRKGRAEEFADFRWSGDLPDPQDERTFLRSKLSWDLRQKGNHRILLDFHKELFRLRREVRALRRLDRNSQEVHLLAEEKRSLREGGTKTARSSPLIILVRDLHARNCRFPTAAGREYWTRLIQNGKGREATSPKSWSPTEESNSA